MFTFALAMCLVATGASWLRGGSVRAGSAGARENGTAPSEQDVEALAWNQESVVEEDA